MLANHTLADTCAWAFSQSTNSPFHQRCFGFVGGFDVLVIRFSFALIFLIVYFKMETAGMSNLRQSSRPPKVSYNSPYAITVIASAFCEAIPTTRGRLPRPTVRASQ